MRPDAPSFEIAPVGPRGQRRLPAVAAALVLAVAGGIGLAVSERAGQAPGEPSPRSPSVPSSNAAVRTPVAARPSLPPRLLVPGAPVSIAPLLVHAGGPRLLHLGTAVLDGALSAHPLDEWLQARDGSLVCLCRTVRPGPDGIDSVTVRVVRADAIGASLSETDLVTSTSLSPGEAAGVPSGSGTTVHGALAPDRRGLLVGVAERSPDGWTAFALSVDLAGERDPRALPIPLDGVPADADAVDVSWAALESGGADTRAIATVSARSPELRRRTHVQLTFTADRAAIERIFPAQPAEPSRRCRASAGPFLVEHDALDVCLPAWPPGSPALRRYAPDGSVASDTPLPLPDAAILRGDWWDAGPRRLVHWDASGRWLTVVDPVMGSVVGRVEGRVGTMTPAAVPAGPDVAIDAAAGRVYVLDTADPAWVNSDPVRSPSIRGAPPRFVRVHALDDGALIAGWNAPSTASSIALTPDARYLLVSVAPSDAEPYPSRYAGVIAYDPESGEVRLVAGRVGEVPIRFPGAGRGSARVTD